MDSRTTSRFAALTTLALVTLTGGLLLGAAPAASVGPTNACGYSTSSRDLNGDGFDDVAIGDPYATVDGQVQAGKVTVLFGDADGRIGEGVRRVLTQADLGETPEAGDHFGWSVKIADLDLNSRCAGILIGSPGEDLAGKQDAGIVQIASYSPDREGGPGTMSGAVLTQALAHGTVESGDQFGYSLAVLGYTFDDPLRIAVGAPGEDVGAADSAGVVDLIDYFTSGVRNQEVGQGTRLEGATVPGTPQSGDRFGAALTTARVDLGTAPGSYRELGLVVGAPGDVVDGADNAGSVTVLREQLNGATQITQESPGVPGDAAPGDQFGFSVALGPEEGELKQRTLAIGAPGDEVGSVARAGSVTLMTNRDHTFVPRAVLTQGIPAVGGGPEAGDRFGYALAFDSQSVLGIGVPYEDLGRTVDAGTAQFVQVPDERFPLQRLTSVGEDSPGTPGTVSTSNRFGEELSAVDGVRERIWAVTSPYQGNGSVYVLATTNPPPPRRPDGGSVNPHAERQDASGHRAWVPGQDGIPAAGANRFGWSTG